MLRSVFWLIFILVFFMERRSLISLMLRIRRLQWDPISRFASTSSSFNRPQNHYSTLGVDRNATVKQIKTAFYELSKKYHPDTAPNDKVAASIKFQDIANAYEVLSNAGKRKEYDARFGPSIRHSGPESMQDAFGVRNKKYTDLDIDFQDLERFQRTARFVFEELQRRQQTGSYKYESSEEFLRRYDTYRSNLAADRDREERKIREEIAEDLRRARYKTPTFEQLLQEQRKRQEKKFNENLRNWVIISTVLVVVMLAIDGFRF